MTNVNKAGIYSVNLIIILSEQLISLIKVVPL